jgi:selenoprotein W-related protein
LGQFWFLESTKIDLIGQKWRFRDIDFDHLTDEKHIGIFINYNGKFDGFINIFMIKPSVVIEYCPKCGWLLRAAYMAQEILSTFTDDIRSVTLQPSEVGGSYKIFIDEKKIFDRKERNGFPEIKEIKQLIRDLVNPGKSLGHADRKLDETK